MITLSEKAAEYIRNQLEKSGNGVGLRLGVKKAGCSGFAYSFEIAAAAAESEQAFESHGVKVLVAPENLAYLDGTQIDYVRQGLGYAFKFDNPNARHQCGCGESFGV